MPIDGFDDWDDCIATMTEEEGYDQETAEKICGALESEKENPDGNYQKLLSEILDGASSILTELQLDNFSFVENPAQPSHFVRVKSDKEHNFQVEEKIVRKKEKDWSIVFGPVMVPNVTDKQEDVIPSHVIEKAAHEFLINKRTDKVDGDHMNITNKGDVAESWILEEAKEYKAPNDETITYPKGTWMVGVKPTEEAKEKIENGEWTGFSILGNAQGVDLDKFTKSLECPECGTEMESKDEDTEEKKDQDDIEENNKKERNNGWYDKMSETEKDELLEQVQNIQDKVNDLQETQEQLSEQLDSDEEEKQEVEDLPDALEWIDENAPAEVIQLVQDAIQGEEEASAEDEKGEKEEEQEEEEDKEAKAKAHSGEKLREKTLDGNAPYNRSFMNQIKE